jgi:hypothetical protein
MSSARADLIRIPEKPVLFSAFRKRKGLIMRWGGTDSNSNDPWGHCGPYQDEEAAVKRSPSSPLWPRQTRLATTALFSFEGFLKWRFRAFLNKESSKTSQKPFGGSPCQKLLAEEVEGKKTFFLSSFPNDLFLSRFWVPHAEKRPKTP